MHQTAGILRLEKHFPRQKFLSRPRHYQRPPAAGNANRSAALAQQKEGKHGLCNNTVSQLEGAFCFRYSQPVSVNLEITAPVVEIQLL